MAREYDQNEDMISRIRELEVSTKTLADRLDKHLQEAEDIRRDIAEKTALIKECKEEVASDIKEFKAYMAELFTGFHSLDRKLAVMTTQFETHLKTFEDTNGKIAEMASAFHIIKACILVVTTLAAVFGATVATVDWAKDHVNW